MREYENWQANPDIPSRAFNKSSKKSLSPTVCGLPLLPPPDREGRVFGKKNA